MESTPLVSIIVPVLSALDLTRHRLGVQERLVGLKTTLEMNCYTYADVYKEVIILLDIVNQVIENQ